LAFFSVRASYIAVVGGDPRTPLSAALGLAAALGLVFFGLAFFSLALFLSFMMAFTNFLKGDARCGLNPAQWRCKVFFTKERVCYEIPEEPARRDRTRMPILFLDGPTE
jgi:hypothetical protein